MSAFDHLDKPHWLQQRDFDSLCRIHEKMIIAIAEAGKQPAIDFIKPHLLVVDGRNSIENLTIRPTCKLGLRATDPDNYWSRSFYWDRDPDLSKFRTAQRNEAYYRLVTPPSNVIPTVNGEVYAYSDWFNRSVTSISQLAYVLAWIVASGKTLAILALALGYNKLTRTTRGNHAPRCARVLVLAKEQALRDQLADDLTREPVQYGILSSSPKVAILADKRNGASSGHLHVTLDHLCNRAWLRNSGIDVVVACLQSFWINENDCVTDRLNALGNFDIIIIDEPHFARDRVVDLAKYAPHAICFGLTGTPITATGEILRSLPLFSVYDYQQANENDHSLKLLSNEPGDMQDIIAVLDIESADIKAGPDEYTVNAVNDIGEDYRKNIQPVISVGRSVIQKLEELDRYIERCKADPLHERRLAGHRPKGAIPDLFYPPHAMITVESYNDAKHVVHDLNTIFESNRRCYPREQGWLAEMVHSKRDDLVDTGPSERRLDPEHPWLLAKKNGGKMSHRGKHGSRILVCIGMGREGLNNPYCCVMGVASKIVSMHEHVQRTFGRPLRSVIEIRDGQLHCPPRDLDRPHILTHSSYGNWHAMEEAARYLVNMREKLIGMRTVEDLLDSKPVESLPSSIDTANALSNREKYQILAAFGEAVEAGTLRYDCGLFPETSDVFLPPGTLSNVLPGSGEAKQGKAQELINRVHRHPESLQEELHLQSELQPVSVVVDETLKCEPSNEDLRKYAAIHLTAMRVHPDELVANDRLRELLKELYKRHHQQIHEPPIVSCTTSQSQKRSITAVVAQNLGTDCSEQRLHAEVGRAVKLLFGCPKGESVANGTEYDDAAHNALLGRPEIRNRIVGYVIKRLLMAGFCPRISRALGIKVLPVE